GDAEGYAMLAQRIARAWNGLGAGPLSGARMRVVGESLLEAKVGASLVPTLAQSFAITAALIFLVFLFVFRSATARLLAMIPSLSSFPPLRQFGLVTSAAFILALIADFTALPAGLWMVDRRRERHGSAIHGEAERS